jgi:hypothetical protein
MTGGDGDAARELADGLLEAQVQFILDELSGARLREVIGQAVDDVLDIASRQVLGVVVDAERVKLVVRRIGDRAVGSPLVADLVEQISDALYAVEASDEHLLEAVVPRERVDAIVVKVLSMRTAQDRAMDRLAQSPLVSALAATFVSKIIADFVAQNRAMAQKVPGMSSLFSLGTSAANMVRNPLDQFFGDAAERSAQYAMRRTNNAIRDLVTDARLREAAMEVWDLQAQEPVGALRDYLEEQDLRELARLGYELLLDARGTAFFGEMLDACVEVVFARYGEWDLAGLLTEVGIERDAVVDDLIELAEPIVEAAKSDGALADLIRARLEPFFHSAPVLALLDAARSISTE